MPTLYKRCYLKFPKMINFYALCRRGDERIRPTIRECSVVKVHHNSAFTHHRNAHRYTRLYVTSLNVSQGRTALCRRGDERIRLLPESVVWYKSTETRHSLITAFHTDIHRLYITYIVLQGRKTQLKKKS